MISPFKFWKKNMKAVAGYNLLHKNDATRIVIFGFLTLEDGTDRLSLNAVKKFPLFAA
jgi:hypothetical protein